MEVGRSIPRVDAADKVTGRAKYTDDLCPRPVLEAKILHSTIANGSASLKPKVEKVVLIPDDVVVIGCLPERTAAHAVGVALERGDKTRHAHPSRARHP